jgi:hypothetical protein
VVGVVTEAGDEYRTGIAASNGNAKVLYESLVPAGHLPDDFLAEIDAFRTFSSAFKIDVVADVPPQYRAFGRVKAGFDYPT